MFSFYSSSLRRRQFSYQASMDSNDISDLHNRNHGNYMMSRYNDVDSIPDDVGKILLMTQFYHKSGTTH